MRSIERWHFQWPWRTVPRTRFSRSCHSWSRISQQEAQLILTNLRDAFGGQSTSPNIVAYHSMLGTVSYCAIVTLSLRRAVFYDIRLQKCRDLENRVRGPSRSLEMSPCDRAHMTFYSNYGAISCRFWDIQCRKMSRSWNQGQRSLKVIESCTIVYGFLLVFFSNFVPKTHSLWDIWLVSIPWPWNPGLGVTQGHWKYHPSIERIRLPIDVL